jgi:hypothetical protein
MTQTLIHISLNTKSMDEKMSILDSVYFRAVTFVNFIMKGSDKHKFLNPLSRLLRLIFYPIFIILMIVCYGIVNLFAWFIAYILVLAFDLVLLPWYIIVWIVSGKTWFWSTTIRYTEFIEDANYILLLNGN